MQLAARAATGAGVAEAPAPATRINLVAETAVTPASAAQGAGATNSTPQPDGELGRPLSEALRSIERAVKSVRIVPLLLVVGALWWGQTVLIPVVMSILVSYALEPAVARLETWRLPRLLGVPLLLAALIVGSAAAVYGLRGQVVAFGNRLPDAAHKLALTINREASGALAPMTKMRQAANELEQAATPGNPPRSRGEPTPVRIEEPTLFKWNDLFWQGSHGAIALAGQLFAITCLVYYLLVAGDTYKRKVVRIVGPSMSSKKTTVQILLEIDRQVARFLWARVLISVVVGAAVWLAFYFTGIEDAGVWAMLAALLFPIPVVGHVVVTIAAGLAGFVQFDSLVMASVTAGIMGTIAAVEGNVLTPWLMSRVGDMNAAAVLVSLMFWGWLWGVWGLLLAVPITAAIKVVCERVDELNPFAEILKQE